MKYRENIFRMDVKLYFWGMPEKKARYIGDRSFMEECAKALNVYMTSEQTMDGATMETSVLRLDAFDQSALDTPFFGASGSPELVRLVQTALEAHTSSDN